MNITAFIQQFEASIEGIELGSIAPDTVLASIQQWDSLALLTTLAMADAEYGVTLSGNEINACVTIQNLFDLVKAKKG